MLTEDGLGLAGLKCPCRSPEDAVAFVWLSGPQSALVVRGLFRDQARQPSTFSFCDFAALHLCVPTSSHSRFAIESSSHIYILRPPFTSARDSPLRCFVVANRSTRLTPEPSGSPSLFGRKSTTHILLLHSLLPILCTGTGSGLNVLAWPRTRRCLAVSNTKTGCGGAG